MRSNHKQSELFGWMMWSIAALFYALDYFLHTAPNVLIAPITQTLNAQSPSLAGSTMGIYFPIYALSQLPAGYLLDRLGLKIPLSLAALIVGVGLWVTTWATIPALYAGRALTAIGSSFAFLGALKTAATWLPSNRIGLAAGLTNSVGTILGGAILGLPILNFLITQKNSNWQDALMIMAGGALLLSVVILVLLRSKKNASNSILSSKSLLMKPINKIQIMHTIILALYAGIMVGTLVNAMGELYGITILQQQLGISKTQATNIYPWLFAGIAIGGPLHGYFSNRLRISPPRWMLVFCVTSFLLYLIQLQCYHLKISSSAYIVLFFLTGVSASSMLLTFSWSREIYPKHFHARAFALINMIIALCGYQFQTWFGILENTAKNSSAQLLHGLWLFALPLFLAIPLCYWGSIRIKEINEE